MKTQISVDDKDLSIKIDIEQDPTPVRFNAMASGDRDVDRKAEDKILRELKRGNGWAWASVHVTVTYRDILHGDDYLGCCSYEDEADFKADGYYTDMVKTCVDQINCQLRCLIAD